MSTGWARVLFMTMALAICGLVVAASVLWPHDDARSYPVRSAPSNAAP